MGASYHTRGEGAAVVAGFAGRRRFRRREGFAMKNAGLSDELPLSEISGFV